MKDERKKDQEESCSDVSLNDLNDSLCIHKITKVYISQAVTRES